MPPLPRFEGGADDGMREANLGRLRRAMAIGEESVEVTVVVGMGEEVVLEVEVEVQVEAPVEGKSVGL